MPVIVTGESARAMFDAEFGRGASERHADIVFEYGEDGSVDVRTMYVDPLRYFSIVIDTKQETPEVLTIDQVYQRVSDAVTAEFGGRPFTPEILQGMERYAEGLMSRVKFHAVKFERDPANPTAVRSEVTYTWDAA